MLEKINDPPKYVVFVKIFNSNNLSVMFSFKNKRTPSIIDVIKFVCSWVGSIWVIKIKVKLKAL